MVKEVKEEPQRFHKLVDIMREEILRVDSPAARLAITKWIPIINAFIKAKIALDNQDLKAVINLSLELLLETSNNLFIQDQWARCVSRISQKHQKLDMKIQWLPFYKLIVTTHFKRKYSYERLRLKEDHLGSIIALICCCCCYFLPSSAVEICDEFRPALDDLAHNSSLEAMGFMALFMPSTIMDKVESSLNKSPSAWINKCLSFWAGLPNCWYWNF